jgi:hypothetical protein
LRENLARVFVRRFIACMSAAEVIAEIETLPPAERATVLDHFLQVREEEIPPALARGMADALAGRGYDMERVMNGEPPPTAK